MKESVRLLVSEFIVQLCFPSEYWYCLPVFNAILKRTAK